ncbi:MAG TPA: hypothetical protein VI299_07660 [Polyangiales bacterium]
MNSFQLRPWAVLRSLRTRVVQAAHGARAKPPARAQIGSPYDEIDEEFHTAYASARVELEHDVPVLIVLADELVFVHGGERRSWSFSPFGYHLIKMISHAPLAVFSSLQPDHAAALREDAVGRRASLQRWVDQGAAQLRRESGLAPETTADLHTVLDACTRFLQRPTDELTGSAAQDFARALGPVLLRLIDAATQLQLDALHEHVEESLRGLSPETRRRLEVIVTGNHQARVRSLPMQYFQKRMAERVTYAEGVDNEQAALALVGIRQLDRAIADAFFADPSRMQRDLLGDSAQQRLAGSALTPIA